MTYQQYKIDTRIIKIINNKQIILFGEDTFGKILDSLNKEKGEGRNKLPIKKNRHYV